MKTFFKNIFLFSTVLVVLLGSLLLIMHIIKKKSYNVNYRVENKIKNFTIDSKKLNILIAGDSWAEQQLIPKIFEEQYGYNSFNIATNSCDLVSTVASLNKHYVNSKDKILKESDLLGHLKNTDKKNGNSKLKKQNKKIENDYQLSEAINLLKGLNIISLSKNWNKNISLYLEK